MSSSNNNTSNCGSTTRTILRIKRRRTEEPVPYIRLEGLDGSRAGGNHNNNNSSISEDLVDTTVGKVGTANSNVHPRSTALWKRFEPQDKEDDSYRIVNAIMSSSPGNDEDGRQTKRRKLTVLETTTSDLPSVISMPAIAGTRKSTKSMRVLDPLTRLVDDSLQEVHIGNKRVAEHYRFVTTDPRLSYDAKKWLTWCHSEGGNLLHACSLWNDIEMANELLHLFSTSSGHSSSLTTTTLTEAVDADGRTPYEVAQLSGHESICEVLEAFGGDTSNFVYDIFCLDDQENPGEYRYGEKDGSDFPYGLEEQPMAVELTSGVGYWTPDGELVLEAPEKSPASLNHVFDEDGEIDSNCEEYGGNDYPEDEDWNDDFFAGHRHNPIDMYAEEADYSEFVHSAYD